MHMSQPLDSFSVTVPAHRDEAVLEATVSGLCASDQPPAEVLVVVGSQDRATREVAERVADRHRALVDVVVDPSLFDVMSGDVDGGRAGGGPATVGAPVAGASGDAVQPADSFSVTVPAHRDEAVLEATVSGLFASDQA